MQPERPLKKVSKVTKNKIIDINTGEIQEEEEIIDAYIDKEPDYVKIYLKDIVALNDLPKGLDRVINVLLKVMSYDNMIILNSFIKKQMAQELGYKTVQVLNNNINKLVNAEILFRKGTGTYQVNARYFGRGHWHDIQEIRLQQVYSAKGRELKTEITYKNDEPPQN
ncbi:replication/maintenance protein RepL [Bacillus thuringiensis]|uniref:replication/maintenance protein RepL n=1 Tax=Bacillus thuringiensis TaxID=1428 RepID=UPI0011A667E6|nr:replication/maintenance protein RepL [Bacillus thuringiensis]